MIDEISVGSQFIAGKRSKSSGIAYRSQMTISDDLKEVNFYEATAHEVKAAAEAAADAYHTFRNTLPQQRALLLEQIATELEAMGQGFVRDVVRETGLGQTRVESELARTTNQMRHFARTVRRGDFYDVRIDTTRADIRQFRIGVGPVAVFGASNFPIAFSVAGGDTASALAAGCPVVVKAHSAQLATSEWVASAVQRAIVATNMPVGTFNMIYGDKVGALLVAEPGIKAVGFTGSLQGGRALFDIASSRPDPIPVFAEMSSINPVFLLPGALRKDGRSIAGGMAASILTGSGQLCTCPGLIIGLKSPELDLFISDLVREMGGQRHIMLNDKIAEAYRTSVENMAEVSGVRMLGRLESSGRQVSSMVFTAESAPLFSEKRPLETEMFGPATVVAQLESEAEMFAYAKKLAGQLTATIFAADDDVADANSLKTILEEKAGRLLFNGFPTGVEVCDAMVHGGPYPATTDSRGTSVGSAAIERFLRPICYQNYPSQLLPLALCDENPLGILRLVNGEPEQPSNQHLAESLQATN